MQVSPVTSNYPDGVPVMSSRLRKRGPSLESSTLSHFAADREVDMRLLNPSGSSSSVSEHVWIAHSKAQTQSTPDEEPSIVVPPLVASGRCDVSAKKRSTAPVSSLNRVVSRKKVVSPRRKDPKTPSHASTSKRRLHVSPVKASPIRKSKAKKELTSNAKATSQPQPPKKMDSKPWRKNMKYSNADKAPELLPEDSCRSKKERKSREDMEEVKEYMRNKSNKYKAESLKERKQSFQRKEAIKNRLEELENRRKEKVYNNTSPKKNFCPVHGYNNSGQTGYNEVGEEEEEVAVFKHPKVPKVTSSSAAPKRSSVETLKEVQRNKLDNQLFLKLEELTKNLNKKSSNQNIPQPPHQKHDFKNTCSELNMPTSKPNSVHQLEFHGRSSNCDSILVQDKNLTLEEKFRDNKVMMDRTTSPIQSLIQKHEKDINFIKKMDSNLLPISLKSDHFNFLSTVKRKFNVEASEPEAPILSFSSGVPHLDDKSRTEDTLSEGPISTSLASYSKKSSSAKEDSRGRISSLSNSISKNGNNNNIPQRQCESERSMRTLLRSSSSHPVPEEHSVSKDNGACVEFVPSALHLRFLAELNQLENVQSTEKHIDKLDRMKDISVVRRDAATMATIIKGIKESKSREKAKTEKICSKKESRAEFENRIRKEFNDLFHNRIQPLIESQTEATRVTADAAKMLASLHKNILESELKSKNNNDKVEKPLAHVSSQGPSTDLKGDNHPSSYDCVSSEASKPSSNTIHEEVISLISKTESSIPEVLSVLEKASRSGDSIRKTISEVMSRKNDDDPPSSCSSVTLNTANITEEIEKEISLQSVFSSSPPRLGGNNNESRFDAYENGISGASSEFTLNMIEQHIQVESSRASNQYLKLKLREKKIVERAKSEMAKLEAEKKDLKSKNQDTSSITKRQKMIVSTVQSQRKEIKTLKDKLKVAERERQYVLNQQRALLKDRKVTKNIHDMTDPFSLSDSSCHTIVPDVSKDLTLVNPSPNSKSSMNRKVSESSEDSMTNVSLSSDHSDAAIRVNVLKDELQKQKSIAKKLREQQKINNKEALKVQAESLKKQIEAYDKLIVRTSDEINQQEITSSFEVVPPQIKTPVSKSRSLSESEKEVKPMENDEEEEENDFLSSKTSISETIETDIHSVDSKSSSSKASTVISERPMSCTKEPPTLPREKDVERIYTSLFTSMMSETVHEFSYLKKEFSPPPKENNLTQDYNPSSSLARPQDLMLTTFDLDEEEQRPLSIDETPLTKVTTTALEDDNDGENTGDPENDFIDDDFGLSSIKKESEELRQQQLLIEEEISRIHEESNSLDKPPPPPPYVVKTSNLRRTPAIVQVPPHIISSRENLEALIPKMVDYIHNVQNGESEEEKNTFLQGLLSDLKEESLYEEPTQFLEACFDTLVELRQDVVSEASTQQNPPWMKQKSLPQLIQTLPWKEKDILLREALFLFGREKRNVKENLVLRSFRKKRSHVENLLANELIGERDEDWCEYDEEETLLKDTLTSQILRDLIKDTAREMSRL